MTGTKSIEFQEGFSEWTHLTAVQYGDENLIYVNGDLVNAENISADLSYFNLSEFEEGGYVGNVLNINAGNVFFDELAIWSKALSQREIDSLYAAAVNQPPVILTTRLKPATEDVFYTDTLKGSDPEASPLSWTLLSGPNLLELDSETGILSFTPTQEETGIQPVTVEVTDGALRDTVTISLEIVEVNEPPRIDSTFPVSQIYKVDSSYAWPLSAFDEEEDSLSWTLHGPQNMILEEDSLKWTPSISQLGLDTLTLMVQDGSLSDTAVQIFLVIGPAVVGTSPSIQNAFSIRTRTNEIRQGATEVYFPDNQPWSVSAFNLNGRQVGVYRETGSGWHALNLRNTGAAVLILRQGNRQAIFNIP